MITTADAAAADVGAPNFSGVHALSVYMSKRGMEVAVIHEQPAHACAEVQGSALTKLPAELRCAACVLFLCLQRFHCRHHFQYAL
jgi:hypothetical protein